MHSKKLVLRWFGKCSDGSDEENCVEKLFGLPFTTKSTTVTMSTPTLQNNDSDNTEDQFRCGDRSCVPSRWVCDGPTVASTTEGPLSETIIQDIVIDQVCTLDEFLYGDGTCIPWRWFCDGPTDCNDNSDEEYCDGNPESEIPRQNSLQNSEEVLKNPQVTSNQCEANQFSCKSEVYCIPNRWVCDGYDDCRDGSDEKDC